MSVTSITKPTGGTFDWGKASLGDLQAAIPLLYPSLPLDPATINEAGLIQLVLSKAKGQSLAELQAEVAQHQEKVKNALGADVLALTFPEGVQDILSRLGTTIVVAEKYTNDMQIKAYQYVAARLKTAKLTVSEAALLPIKDVQRKGTVKFEVIPFSLDEENAAPLDVRNFLKALLTVDPATKFGRTGGKRPCVRYMCPTLMPGRTMFVMISEEYAIVQPPEA
jgi:hypothetical protein